MSKSFRIKEIKNFGKYNYLETNNNKIIKYYKSINKVPKLLYDDNFFKNHINRNFD